MKYILSLMLIVLVSCQKLEYSKDMYEEGRVTYLSFTPQRTEYYPYMDSEGNVSLVYRIIPEEYIIGFSCEHGGFKISEQKAKELFYNFRVGDEVIITYRQVDAVKVENDKEVERHFYDWDFVTAKKLDRNGPKEQ